MTRLSRSGSAIFLVSLFSLFMGCGSQNFSSLGKITQAGLTLVPVATLTYGQGPVLLTTSSASPAPISYAVVSGPGTLTGSQLTSTGVGAINVSATQPASGDYASASASITVNVLPATPQLTFALSGNVAYSTQSIPLNATSNSPGSISYAVISGPGSVSGNLLTLSGPGIVVVSANQSPATNFSSGTVSSNLTVTPGIPTLNLSVAQPITFGTAPIPLLATSDSTGAISYVVSSGPASVSGNLLSFTGAGLVTVAAQQAASVNYTAQTATLTITVAPAAPTLSFASIAAHFVGDSPFAIQATSNSTGSVTYQIVSGPASISGDLVSVNAPGVITVSATIAASINYTSATISTQFAVVAEQVAVTPNITFLQLGASVQLTVKRNGTSPTSGNWVVLGGSQNGSITPQGVFQAPVSMPTSSSVTVGYVVDDIDATAQVNLQYSSPSVLTLNPSTLTQTSTNVELTGTGFFSGVTVLVNGSPVPTTLIDPNHVMFTANLQGPLSTVLMIAAMNPNSAVSQSIALPASFPPLSIVPSTIPLGNFSLTVTGSGFSTSTVATLNGQVISTSLNPDGSLTATGYLAPWISSAATLTVSPSATDSPSAELIAPVEQRAVSYDAASRFATQAAFGPNPQVIEHIQTIGFSAFIDEQMQQAGNGYAGGRIDFIENTQGNTSLLRQRVGWAIANFIVSQARDGDMDEQPFVAMVENDAFGNFRNLLSDISTDTSLGIFLNLTQSYVDSGIAGYRPNQNFARELLQLFSMGPNLLNDDGSIQAAADGTPLPSYDFNTINDLSRALTGWTYTGGNPNFAVPLVCVEIAHDENSKVIFGTTNIPAGQGCLADQKTALDAVFQQPSVPPYISKLLIQHLVKSSPSAGYISRISKVFENDGTGVRGNLAAVVKAILLDPEARAGDTIPDQSDGFVQEPLLFQTFAMNALQETVTDGQVDFVAGTLGEEFWHSPTVFGFYQPTYVIPGTTINSPEFMLINNQSIIQRGTVLWGLVNGGTGGFLPNDSAWLYSTFPNLPQFIEALNHLLYHGQMSQASQDYITQYCSSLSGFTNQQILRRAAFLALNSDSYMVAQ
jgi:uncharacterized protein (DUF1800 family)